LCTEVVKTLETRKTTGFKQTIRKRKKSKTEQNQHGKQNKTTNPGSHFIVMKKKGKKRKPKMLTKKTSG